MKSRCAANFATSGGDATAISFPSPIVKALFTAGLAVARMAP